MEFFKIIKTFDLSIIGHNKRHTEIKDDRDLSKFLSELAFCFL